MSTIGTVRIGTRVPMIAPHNTLVKSGRPDLVVVFRNFNDPASLRTRRGLLFGTIASFVHAPFHPACRWASSFTTLLDPGKGRR